MFVFDWVVVWLRFCIRFWVVVLRVVGFWVDLFLLIGDNLLVLVIVLVLILLLFFVIEDEEDCICEFGWVFGVEIFWDLLILYVGVG